MSAKTVLITGASKGIGFETALALAKKNHRLILADKEDLTKIKEQLIKETSNSNISTKSVDFTALDSVRHLAKDIVKNEEKLNVLVNNAGVFCLGKERTVDGLQATMQVNHFAPFLLTNLLSDKLKDSSPSRVIFTSSTGAFFHRLTIENLNNPEVAGWDTLSSLLNYYNSKLCNIITANGFAERFKNSGVTSNSLHPGMTGTDFLKLPFLKRVLQSPELGAATSIFLSTSENVKKLSGEFFVNLKVHQQPRITSDRNFCDAIWAARIGYQVALNLASRGCRVIIADKDNAEESKQKIIEETGNPNIAVKYLDLGSLQSVRNFAKVINSTEKRIDILVNNAGIGAGNQYTKDGLHPIMQINSFGHFLLTHLLTDLLKKSAPSRIVFTSSFMAFTHYLKLENLNYQEGHPNDLLYSSVVFANANLVNIILADGFGRRLKGSAVTANSGHPGVTRTELFERIYQVLKTPYWFRYFWAVHMWLFGKSAWEGAQTTIHLSVAKELKDVTSTYFWDCTAFPKPPITRNKEFVDQLWAKCEELVKLLPDEKLEETKNE